MRKSFFYAKYMSVGLIIFYNDNAKIRKKGRGNMKPKKQNKKVEEAAILEIVSRYKINLCHQIKEGKNLNQEGLLFDPDAKYDTIWKISSERPLNEEEREIMRVNFILSSLKRTEKEIIWQEFFFVEDKFWWMRKYNRSTFYRLRAKAIDSFYALIR